MKPINKGLGLDHFSESGLPYAPNIKPNITPDKTPDKLSYKPVIKFNFDQPMAVQQEKTERNAGMMSRSFAFIIDVLFTFTLFMMIVWGGFSFNGYETAMILNQGFQALFPLVLLYLVIYMGYFLIQEMTWKKTLGKALFGISIRSQSGFAALGRAFCFFLSVIPFGLGLLMTFIDPKKRCWHDFITDTEVVYAEKH